MQSINTKILIEQSREYSTPLCIAIQKATEVGVVVPSILRMQIEAAGLRINEDHDDHSKHGYRKFENLRRVLIHDQNGAVIAMGASADSDDALLHAMLGYVRERHIEAHGCMPKLKAK